MPDALRLWQETTNRLAREASTRVTSTYLQFAAGNVTRDEAVGIQATIIATAQRRATTFNDLLLAAELTERLEKEYAAAGISWHEAPDAQTARLAKAVSTVFDADVEYVRQGKTPEQVKQLEARSVRARLGRLTDGEVAGASQWSRQTAMQVYEEQGIIIGWYRRVRPDCCAFCRTLAGPGDPARFIHPVSHRMATHPGCHCSQAWVTEIEPWQKWLGPREQMKQFINADLPEIPDIDPSKPSKSPANRYWKVEAESVDTPGARKTAELVASYREQLAVMQAKLDPLQAAVKARRAAIKREQIALGYDYKTDRRHFSEVEKWDPEILSLKGDLRAAKANIKFYEENIPRLEPVVDYYDRLLDAEAAFDALPRMAAGVDLDDREAIAKLTNDAWRNGGHAYQVNCTRCAVTYEMRRRGYDVIASPAGKALSFSKYDFVSADRWRTATGEKVSFTDTHSQKELAAVVEQWPVGARGLIRSSWKSGGGHIWNIERTADGYQFIEAQTDGQAGPLNEVDQRSRHQQMKWSTASVLRVDDLVPTQFVSAWVEARV